MILRTKPVMPPKLIWLVASPHGIEWAAKTRAEAILRARGVFKPTSIHRYRLVPDTKGGADG